MKRGRELKKILIMGACGFVGKYLIDELKDDNYDIIACDINNKNIKYNNVKFHEINILNKEDINNIIKEYNPDYVVNLAAISSVALSWSMPRKTFEVNVIGTLNILEAIKEYNNKCKILLIGSSEEYEAKQSPLKETDKINSNNPYGISKIAQENLAKLYKEKYGLNIVCTRSFNHIGVGQLDQFVIPSFCKQVAQIDKTNKPGNIYVGNLSAYRDISDVKDIVKVYRALLENETDELVYNVGSGNSYKIEELLQYIISLSKQPVKIVVDKNKLRPIDTPYICCDNTKTKEYFENSDIKLTIKEIYEFYRKN